MKGPRKVKVCGCSRREALIVPAGVGAVSKLILQLGYSNRKVRGIPAHGKQRQALCVEDSLVYIVSYPELQNETLSQEKGNKRIVPQL